MLIAFDYDGVIVDSFNRVLGITSVTQGRLGAGRPPVDDDLRLIANLTFSDLARRIGIPSDRLSEFAAIALEFQSSLTDLPDVFPGIVEGIRNLAAKHVIVVISSSSAVEIDRVLERHQLSDVVRGIADGIDRRPKREKLCALMAELDFLPDRTLMVGDSRSDIVEARAAGVKSVGVTWGFQPRDVLLLEKPDYLVSDIAELLSTVASA